MDVYIRYFKVADGPLIDAIQEAKRVNKKAHEQYKAILDDIGAKREYYQIDGRLTCLLFNGKPDGAIYRRKLPGWYPKKNCKVGKDIAARIESVHTVDP